jgi:hypothetical protein
MSAPATLYGPWNYGDRRQQFAYEDTESYAICAAWLDGHGTVEDWGCGVGWAKQFFDQSPYIGIDGAWSRWCDVQADLRTYRSTVDCAMMRHVLEHNADWRTIAANFASSWTARAAVVFFIPPQPEEFDAGGPDWPVPDLAVSGPEVADLLMLPGDRCEFVQIDYPPDHSMQWGWEGIWLMERA